MDSIPQSNPQPSALRFHVTRCLGRLTVRFLGDSQPPEVAGRSEVLVTGMALGAIYDAQCETIYKSVAKIKIEPKDPLYLPMSQNSRTMFPMAADMAIRHDQLIGQYNIVQRCLTSKQPFSARVVFGFSQRRNNSQRHEKSRCDAKQRRASALRISLLQLRTRRCTDHS